MELLNDASEVLLLYHLMIFSDWLEDDELKQNAAYSFNIVIFVTIAIHLCFLIYTVVTETKTKIRRKQCCC